jgi:riboflavin kinase/FMN adenylyltransferase
LNSCSTLKNSITSIAIGGFDGVHRAHQELFNRLDDNGAVVVIETGYANLTPKQYREEYTSYPIFYYPLDDIRHLQGAEFVQLVKEDYPNLKTIVVGYDFHFGNQAKYTTDDLEEFFDGEVIVVDEINHNNIAVHSRIIREFLKNGDIVVANDLLNKPYKIYGEVIAGQGLGKKQFVPTLNIDVDHFLLPKEAIYVTKTTGDGKVYESVSFVGHRITTDGKFAVETHIIDEDVEFEDTTISIEFFTRLRDNKKYKLYEELKEQILIDIQNTKKYFRDTLNNILI